MANESVFTRVFKSIRFGLVSVLGISFFINLLMLASPLYMLQVYDRILTSRSVDTLLLLTIIVVAALATIGFLEAVRSGLMAKISHWMSQALSGETLNVSIKRTLRMEQPANVQSLRDLDTVRGFLTSPTVYPLVDAPWATIYLAAIFLLHPLLGWIALGGALVLLIIAIANDIGTRKRQQAASETAMQALQHAESTVRNADAVVAMGMAPHLVGCWNRANNASLEQQAVAGRRSAVLVSISKFIRLSLQVAILGTGAFLAIGGEISAGAIIAASILVGRALSPVDQAIVTWRSALAARAAYNRLKTHFHNQLDEIEKMSLPEPKGDLCVEALNFAFPGTGEAILKGIQFDLTAGETLALIGSSGSGKTTLVRLILGNLHPLSGHARLDGMDTEQWESADRGQYIGYLPQDVELFAGSVRQNIARMTEGDTEQVIEAARLADVHELIMRLPQGYDTQIGAQGMALSGGQRQRIGLARALYGNPRLVVLDEPNANLDQAGDEALAKVLDTLREHKVTTIIISHRPTVFEWVTKVAVLQDGSLRAFGPKEEVFNKAAASRNVSPARKMSPPTMTYKMETPDAIK